jgi:hypothetical protein
MRKKKDHRTAALVKEKKKKSIVHKGLKILLYVEHDFDKPAAYFFCEWIKRWLRRVCGRCKVDAW